MANGRGKPNSRGRPAPKQHVVDRGPILLPSATSDEGFQGEFELPREVLAAFTQEEEFDQLVNQWDNPHRPDGNDLSKHAEFLALKECMEPLPGLDGAYKRIISPGTGPHPEHDWLVYIDYEMFQPGVKDAIDSTFVHGEPLMFRIGRKVVLPFLDAIVCSMKLEEAADFYLEPHAAFDNLKGMNNLSINKRVKKPQPVLLRVYLVDFTNNPTVRKVSDWSKEEIKLADLDVIYQAALELKALGNDFFVKKNSLKEAQNRYIMAITWLTMRDEEEGEDDEKKKRELMATLSMNVSKVFAESKKFTLSLKYAKAAIEHASRAGKPVQVAKANYRASFACRELKRFEEALPFVNEAIRLEPKDPVLRVYRKKLLQALESAKVLEASMYKKMLGAAVGEGPEKSAPDGPWKKCPAAHERSKKTAPAGGPSKTPAPRNERYKKSVHVGELPNKSGAGGGMLKKSTPVGGQSKTPASHGKRSEGASPADGQSKMPAARNELPKKSVHIGEPPNESGAVGGGLMKSNPFLGLSRTPTRAEIRLLKTTTNIHELFKKCETVRYRSKKPAPVDERLQESASTKENGEEQESKESDGPLAVALTVPLRVRQFIAKKFTRLVESKRCELYIPDTLPRAGTDLMFQVAAKLGLHRARNNKDETLFFRKQKPYTLPSGIDINVLAGL